MNLKSKSIVEEISPVGQLMMYENDVMSKKTKPFLITLFIIDFIAAFLLIPVIIEGDVTLNLFGFVLEFDKPFWAGALYIVINSMFVGLCIFLYLIFCRFLSAKAESLNNTYRTMLLNQKTMEQNQQILRLLNDINEKIDEKAKDDVN